ncbi:BamA/TamA family outer membrane protein [Pseudoxanthomonas daejeonensis]|uniref:BamA/TamA family outer membrane protein n=1 Tax=Pseudoxanthomonas daejeonensis TaxID=266062 RepID=UPI001F53EE26|nr:BamA/TamA family outer membrane protein [Pseudoxanthomonas daejeonensis]UNK56831.1 BamA/TamA family outer membrane protein [Pseudoxanthomonas daejeonensis]
MTARWLMPWVALASGALAADLHAAARAGEGVPAEATQAPGAEPAVAASTFRDPDDGHFDMSKWLLDRHGFLPVPIIITDPALGYGGGMVFAFFHRPKGSASTRTASDGSTQMIAPNIIGALVMKTENGSKAYGGGGMLHFRDDTWRYKGGVADADFNIDFYTSGRLLPETQVAVNLTGLGSMQQVSRRIGDRELFLSAQWIYTDLDPRLQDPGQRPLFDDVDFEQVNSGLGLSLEYDSRDNPFTPSRGYLLMAQGNAYLPEIGSDLTFQTYRAHGYGYWPVGAHLVLGGRADFRHADGDVPFYRLPYIDLRGIASARYQDDTTGVLESELRWNVTPRWAGIGFLGAGRAWGARAGFDEATTAVSKGLGVRYLVARQLGLYMGADYAWGPEDRTMIVQFGGAWR